MKKTQTQYRSDSSLARYMGETRKYAMLDPETELELATRWRETRDPEAAGRLVGSHLRLVAKIARSYLGYGHPLEDLIAEGNLGLMQALQRFDPSRGTRFSTYAILWIQAQLRDYVMRSSSLVRIGTTAAQKTLFFKLRSAQAGLGEINGGELSPEAVAAIADKLGVRESEVVEMSHRLASGDASLNAPLPSEGEAEWQDLLVDDSEDQEDRVIQSDELEQRHGFLEQALGKLNSRERDIIVKRQLSDEPLTLQDLSEQYGVSRERVRQIEARALEKLGRSVRALAMAN